MPDNALRYFAAVANHKSIREAAGELGIAQSALSRQIAKLENSFGVDLFDRHARGVKTTEAGNILLRHARDSLQLSERVRGEIDALRGLQRGTVKLQTIELLVHHFLPVSIARFAKAHPGISFDVTIESTDRIVAAVREGRSDVGLVFYPPRHQNLRSIFRLRDPLMAIVNPRHPLAKAKRISLDEAAAYPIGLTVASTSSRLLVEAAFKARNIHLTPVLETNSTKLLVQYVRSTNGIAFLSRLAPWEHIADGSMVAIPVAEPRFGLATIEAIVLSSRRLSVAVEAFLRVVESELQNQATLR